MNDMPGACQSRGVTEPQRDSCRAPARLMRWYCGFSFIVTWVVSIFSLLVQGVADTSQRRFARADLGRCCVPELDNTKVFSALGPCLNPNLLRGNCAAPVSWHFSRDFCAQRARLGSTPSKRGETKSAEKGRSQAMPSRVRHARRKWTKRESTPGELRLCAAGGG